MRFHLWNNVQLEKTVGKSRRQTCGRDSSRPVFRRIVLSQWRCFCCQLTMTTRRRLLNAWFEHARFTAPQSRPETDSPMPLTGHLASYQALTEHTRNGIMSLMCPFVSVTLPATSSSVVDTINPLHDCVWECDILQGGPKTAPIFTAIGPTLSTLNFHNFGTYTEKYISWTLYKLDNICAKIYAYINWRRVDKFIV